jgi:thiol-disulfide isomerase/thioredoxin
MWKRAAIRRALGSAVAAGLIIWGGMSGIIALINQQTRGLPEVALTDLNERPVDLASLAGDKPTVVNLWATWCPPCIREMPVLEDAQQRYPNVNFVFANQGEHPETIRKFLMAQNLNLSHVLSDRQNRFGRVVGSHGLPTTLFYNAQGHLVDTHMGELSRASLARSLERFDPAYLRPATGSD